MTTAAPVRERLRPRTADRAAARAAARGRLRGGFGFLAAWALGLVALQLVLVAGLVAAQAVPNGPVVRHLAQAVESGDYGPNYVSDGMGGTADKFTECVLLGYGVSSTDDPRSLWYRATGGPRLESCDAGAGQIRALAAGESLQPRAGYYRYWNGYSVITRPVLAVLGVPGLRLVTAGLLLLAALAAWTTTRRRLGTPAALAVVLPVAVASNAVAMPALGFSHGLALAAIAAGVALTAVATTSQRLAEPGGPNFLDRRGEGGRGEGGRGEGGVGWRGAAVGAGLAGALLVYVDLLTTPAMSWSLCAAVAGAVAWGRRERLADAIAALAAAGAAWPVAYGVTWVSRWVLAAVVQGPSVFSAVAGKSAERLSGANVMVSDALGAPTRANLRMWLSTTATARPLLVLAVVVAVVALVVAVRRGGPGRLVVAVVLASPALVVPAWFEVMSNHSQVHAFFTYRSVPAAVGVVVAACLVAAHRGTTPR